MKKIRKKGDTEIAFARRLKEHGRKPKTITAYCNWYYRYMVFLKNTYGKWINPNEVAESEFEEFLTGLACDATVAKSPIDFLDSFNAPVQAESSPSDTLASMLANPQRAIENRRDDQEPPRLRVFAG